MARLLALLLLTLLCVHAKDDVYVGGGAYVQSMPYKDADPVVFATPVIFFDNSLFYIRWTRVGMYFYGAKETDYSWGFSITAQPQPLGYYETSEFYQLNSRNPTAILDGMDERFSGWEGGLAASFESHEWFGEFLVLNDITGRSNGTKLRLEAGKTIRTGRWLFVPSFLAIWFSQPMMAYYYGVPENDADLSIGRPAYRPNAAFNFSAQSYIKYSISDHWHLLGNVRVDRLADTIYDSPIVGKHYMTSGMLSALYSFNLFGKEKAALNIPESTR